MMRRAAGATARLARRLRARRERAGLPGSPREEGESEKAVKLKELRKLRAGMATLVGPEGAAGMDMAVAELEEAVRQEKAQIDLLYDTADELSEAAPTPRPS